ncbi:hypothetical protein [Desulfofundulus salinus]|uniref:Uncharacterized protein n=1 Tax=Desulfofundulus salinus TaxID=2419843 RepID=A0A494WZQ5_9FIRM|nr:hypothetical protein [Desulfofundulus salinum]RKO66140.1 hypothetical protein D7024_03735 [Desulfofundulus salinum]
MFVHGKTAGSHNRFPGKYGRNGSGIGSGVKTPAPAWTGRTLATIEKLGFRVGRRGRTVTGSQTDGGGKAGSEAAETHPVAGRAGGGEETGSLQEQRAGRGAGPVQPDSPQDTAARLLAAKRRRKS